MDPPVPPLPALLARGARMKCPRCGEGPLFVRYNVMRERCSACGLVYLEDQGALFGHLFVLDRALFVFPLVAMIFFRAYVPSMAWFLAIVGVLMFLLLYTLPHRVGMSLALEYWVRKRYRGDG